MGLALPVATGVTALVSDDAAMPLSALTRHLLEQCIGERVLYKVSAVPSPHRSR